MTSASKLTNGATKTNMEPPQKRDGFQKETSFFKGGRIFRFQVRCVVMVLRLPKTERSQSSPTWRFFRRLVTRND